jgi:ABC-type transport system involved in cytochrome bd biosynthesis fused ATPase/permease subunit
VVLDETAASLAQLSANYFLIGLRAERPDLAVLLNNHRPSALVNMDRNVILANGELGTFVMDDAQEQLGKSYALSVRPWNSP